VNLRWTPTTYSGSASKPKRAAQKVGDDDRYDHRADDDDYTQPGNLCRLMTPDQQQRLFDNIAAAVQGAPEEIVRRQLPHFTKADPAYGAGVAKALGRADEPVAAE